MRTGTKKGVIAAATKAAEKEGLKQEVKIRELRSEIEKTGTVLQFAKVRDLSETLQAQLVSHTRRMVILLQDELNLKRLFGDFKKGEKKALERLDKPGDLFMLPIFARVMNAVSNVALLGDYDLAGRMKHGITIREKRIKELMGEMPLSGVVVKHKLVEFEQFAYMLALAKSFASPPERGKKLMTEYHDYAGDILRSGVAEALLNYDPSLESEWPGEWIANLKAGIANMESKLGQLKSEAESMEARMGALAKMEFELIDKLATLGAKPELPPSAASLKKFISSQEDELLRKQNELAPLIRAVVEAAPESKVHKFEGLEGPELRHLAAFWEAYSEYPSAADRLTHIYFILHEWEKARNWVEQDINRGFNASNMDWATDSLRFAVEISKAAGNKEWESEFRKQLNAHQAASVPMIMMPNLFATHEPPRRKPHGGAEVA